MSVADSGLLPGFFSGGGVGGGKAVGTIVSKLISYHFTSALYCFLKTSGSASL